MDAIKETQLAEQLSKISSQEKVFIYHDLKNFLYYWFGDPTEASINRLKSLIPILEHILDFEIIMSRLASLEEFNRGKFGIKITEVIPEFLTILNIFEKEVQSIPSGIEKAELWLRSVAREAGANSDLEAVIYLASRGEVDQIDVQNIVLEWYKAICDNLERELIGGRTKPEIIQRARERTISIVEAAEALKIFGTLPRFFAFRDEEEDSIDPTMFRAVEWLSITGFKPWLESAISDLSTGSTHGLEPAPGGWWLFNWCRSDLALKMSEKPGLEAWLWGFINGQIDQKKPWIVFWNKNNNPQPRSYIPIAGIIPFLWNRIKPQNMTSDVLNTAIDFLFQTQLRSGAWPLLADDSEPSLLATCAAIHGLALQKPSGWERVASDGAKWLKTQQNQYGFWHISGGPAVMLTVLILDSINLGEGNFQVTFNTQDIHEIETLRITNDTEIEEPNYECENEEWFRPEFPKNKIIPIEEAHNLISPKLLIIVATDLELKHVLRLLKPLTRKKQIYKTSFGTDIYYLGRFGAYESVVVLCSESQESPTGSTLTSFVAIDEWNPKVCLMPGIAFGASRSKHKPADVLVPNFILPYEHQRVGKSKSPRSSQPNSSPPLLNRFRQAKDWKFIRPDKTISEIHIGPILSGSKLIDNLDFKNELLSIYPNAIGGEMEIAGVWASAERKAVHWIMAKGVCDWGEQKTDKYQEIAAAAAVSLCLHVFSDPHTLDGI